MSKLNLSNILNEIKVNKPTEIFTFKDDPTYGIIAGRYIVVGEDEDDYKLQNLKTKGFEYVSKHYAKNNRIEQPTNEIKVNPPVHKRKAFDDLADLDYDVLCTACRFDTLDSFLEAYGINSFEELGDGLGDEFVPVIDNYFKAIKPEDIKLIDHEDWIISTEGYKSVVLLESTDSDLIYTALLKF